MSKPVDRGGLSDAESILFRVARVVASHGLVDAFGHVSMRIGRGTYLITPPSPLGLLTADARAISVSLDAEELPPGAPKEAWIHSEIYRRRAEVGGIVRAQPPAVAKADAARRLLIPLSGHAALLAPGVAHHDDARLVRERGGAERLVDVLGDASAVTMRGNGAVTVGATPEIAAAAIWVLERTAELVLAAGDRATELPSEQREAWAATAPELLPRIYAYLAGSARSAASETSGETL